MKWSDFKELLRALNSEGTGQTVQTIAVMAVAALAILIALALFAPDAFRHPFVP